MVLGHHLEKSPVGPEEKIFPTPMLQTMIADALLSNLKTFIRSQTCQESSDVNIDNSNKYCFVPNLQNRKRIDKNPPTSCVPYFILRGLEFLFGNLGPQKPSLATRLPLPPSLNNALHLVELQNLQA